MSAESIETQRARNILQPIFNNIPCLFLLLLQKQLKFADLHDRHSVIQATLHGHSSIVLKNCLEVLIAAGNFHEIDDLSYCQDGFLHRSLVLDWPGIQDLSYDLKVELTYFSCDLLDCLEDFADLSASRQSLHGLSCGVILDQF